MLTIEIPGSFLQERTYIIDVLFRNFLGIEYLLSVSDSTEVYTIRYGVKTLITIEDHFFSRIVEGEDYKNEKYLPDPVMIPNVPFSTEPTFISIYHRENLDTVVDSVGGILTCRSDIFAASFFMLTRWEEHCIRNLDLHERVSSKDCIAGKFQFLDRPIVNEYVEFIWNILSSHLPEMSRKMHHFQLIPTHDVDVPFEYVFLSPISLMRQLIGDIIKRKNVKTFAKRIVDYTKTKIFGPTNDPYNTFLQIIRMSDEIGVKSYFNFFGGRTSSFYDCVYDLNDTRIQKVIRMIHMKGHFIGLHPSYHSFNNPTIISNEYAHLRKICSSLGIVQAEWGGRQHYLKWDSVNTPKNWDNAGLEFDSSLGFYDMPGFRCGVCYPFPLFDLKNRKKLSTREIPLIAMENSFFGYAKLGFDDSLSLATTLYRQTKKYNGTYVILWHNNALFNRKSDEYKLYHSLLQLYHKGHLEN